MNYKKSSFRRLLALYGLYAKMDVAWLLRDTVYALLLILADVISNISIAAGMFLLAWRFGGIGGMNQYEVLLMLGYATVVPGIFQMFFSSYNAGMISRRIGRGQLDHMFLQPIPMRIQLLAEGFIPVTGNSSLLVGIGIMWVALSHLDIPVSALWVLSVLLNLLVTTALMLALAYLSASLAFYAPAQAEEISAYVVDATWEIGMFPLSGMPLGIQIPLLTVFPAGLMAWFPTMALLGKPPLGLASSFPLIFTIGVAILAAILFRKGLRYYVKKGSNRYSAGGHRR